MRINYYMFPENTPEGVLLKNGCAVVLKSGEEIYTDNIPEDIVSEVLEKGGQSQFLGSNSVLTNIFINLAWLQGYTFAGVCKVEEE